MYKTKLTVKQSVITSRTEKNEFLVSELFLQMASTVPINNFINFQWEKKRFTTAYKSGSESVERVKSLN